MKEAAWAIYLNVCVFFAPVFLSEPIKLVFHLASLAADSIDLYQFLGLFLFKWWFYLYIFKGKRMHAWKQHSIRHIHSALVDCRSVYLLIISMRSKYCAVIGCIGAERIEHDDQVQWADFLLFHIHRVTRSAFDEVFWFWNGATLFQFILKCSKFQAVDLFLSFLYLNAA